ncbi:MAG: hypothetical protein LBQ74_13725 [Prevotella sp.]|jgi:hypothetical protein|nr:hypothetical protein [Prevotella sp.]
MFKKVIKENWYYSDGTNLIGTPISEFGYLKIITTTWYIFSIPVFKHTVSRTKDY